MANRGGSWIFAIVFGPVVMLIGFAVAYFVGMPMIREAQASKAWPTVPGEVTRSGVTSERRDNKTMYSHEIQYRYTVNDQQYHGDRIWIAPTSSSSSSRGADRLVAEYPVRSNVDVYHNPDDPAASVLQPGATWTTYLPVGIGGLFGFIGFCVTTVLVFKIIAGIFFVGAAASSFASNSSQSSSFSNTPSHSASPRSSSDDDGIDIG